MHINQSEIQVTISQHAAFPDVQLRRLRYSRSSLSFDYIDESLGLYSLETLKIIEF